MNLKRCYQTLSISSAVAALGTVAALTTAAPASALTAIPYFSYSCTTTNCSASGSQFRTKVSSVGPTQVLFQFFNDSTDDSSITNIFLKDAAPLSLASFDSFRNSNGFSQKDAASGDFSFAADDGSFGVKSGGSIGLVFNIREGFANPFNAVVTDLRKGNLRVGLRAEEFGDEDFANDAVPEPMTMIGTGAAIGIGALMKRRADRRKAQQS